MLGARQLDLRTYVCSLVPGYFVGEDVTREVTLVSLRAAFYTLPSSQPQQHAPLVWLAHGRRALDRFVQRVNKSDRPLLVLSFAPELRAAEQSLWSGRVQFIREPGRP